MRKLLFVLTTTVLVACTGYSGDGVDLRLAVEQPRFGDNDPVPLEKWGGKYPWRYPVHGIDVAKWQGDIDWNTARRSGVSFAFIKATEGRDHLDKRFALNWAAARQAGMVRGAYHFYYFCRPAIEQARWFIRNVPRDPQALPPVLDMEWNGHSKNCRTRPDPQTVRAEMQRFLSIVERHYGKRPLIYTTVDFYRDNQLSTFGGYEYWLRSVAGHPSQVYPGQNWSFWQYTGTGKIPGIEGDTDINVFTGSPETWRRWVEARTR